MKRIGPGMQDQKKNPGLLRTTDKYTKEDLFFHNQEDIRKTSGRHPEDYSRSKIKTLFAPIVKTPSSGFSSPVIISFITEYCPVISS